LPDGRKVDAKTLEHEFKNNFLPDYTRKSQELSRYKSQNNQQLPNNQQGQQQPAPQNNIPADKPWLDSKWVPQSYSELVSIAEANALARIQADQQAQFDNQSRVAQYFDTQMAEIKKVDPKANEGEIYAHATKYGFQDLNQAYKNLKEFQNIRMTTEQNTIKNMNARANEPVGAKPTPAPVNDTSVAMNAGQKYSSAVEMFRATNK
jgi:hypothetical protein